MSKAAIEYAATVLDIKGSLYSMSAHDRERVKNYVRIHNSIELRDDVLLHNDAPPVEGMRGWSAMSRLVFRGSGAPYAALGGGFSAAPDGRFDKPVIIRDRWNEKRVTTHMQTKAVLAWSKSFYVALEYAYGCIKGGMGQVIPGYLHFCWIQTGLDVVEAVREWEGNNPGVFLDEIDPGQQFEIITPTVPQNCIVATWELRKPPGGGGDAQFIIADKTLHPGNFAAVMNDYNAINNALPNLNHVYNYVERGNYVDRQVLFIR